MTQGYEVIQLALLATALISAIMIGFAVLATELRDRKAAASRADYDVTG